MKTASVDQTPAAFLFLRREETVEADDFRALCQQAFAEVRAEEPRAADYDNALSKCMLWIVWSL